MSHRTLQAECYEANLWLPKHNLVDLTFGNSRWGDDRGRAYVLVGWAVPWDEATWW